MERKLEVKNLQISFRTQAGIVKAVRDISFNLHKGETLAIVGESGSGKSVTSKAIIGILAGNSIIEGGEILYDGQDLLKISEEDFHKIRGDKIAMIFQDPMSSLNPIMRVGKQLTEAMILNGKARQKNSRNDFNFKLKLLNKNMDEVNPENKNLHQEKCKTFDNFCISSIKIENLYNNANSEAISLQKQIENDIFLTEKKQKIDLFKEIKFIKKDLKKTVHPYVLENSSNYEEKLNNFINLGKKNLDKKQVFDVFNEISEALKIAINKEKPNFFTLGFYMLNNPNFDASKYSVKELNKLTKKYIDDNFMFEFLKVGSQAILNSHKKSMIIKKEILNNKEKILDYFRQDSFIAKETYSHAKKLIHRVNAAVDLLEINKKSVEYTFASSFTHSLDVYFNGLKNNPKMQEKYEKQLKKYNELLAKGKTITWKVIPPLIVDLKLAKNNIVKVLENLFASYEKDFQKEDKFNSDALMLSLVDYFKELASNAVYKVTAKLAKVKALDLLKEVGIPEPVLRYNQYPFEFSGGMRQRIVIAIALAANPDILICDEPTTALDVTIQSQILELINKIKKERNLSIIFITHDLGVVANMADKIAVMYAGKIVEYGTSEDIFYDPRHPYTWALLSSMPDLETKEKLEAIPGTPPNMIYPPQGDAFAARNKYALKIDFELEPPLFEVSKTHFAATWLLHPNAPKVQPPQIILNRIERMKKEANNDDK